MKWNVCEPAVPFVKSIKEASHVFALFKNNLSMSVKRTFVNEVTVNFIWNQRGEDGRAVFFNVTLHVHLTLEYRKRVRPHFLLNIRALFQTTRTPATEQYLTAK